MNTFPIQDEAGKGGGGAVSEWLAERLRLGARSLYDVLQIVS